MFAVERIKKIKEVLLEYKHVDINTLCSLLSVSIATVRRDLDKLEEEGFLKKAHGGAIINEVNEFEVLLNGLEDPFSDEKKQIGIIAAEMIEDNDIIFLGGGNTCHQIARSIKDKRNLTIITNNLNIAIELAHCKNINVMMPGGDLEVADYNLTLVGEATLEYLDKIYFNKTFFTVSGVSLEFGYTDNNKNQATIKKHLIANSNETIVVADSSKFGKRAFTQVCSIDKIKRVITNVQLDDRFKEYFFDSEVKLFTSFEDKVF